MLPSRRDSGRRARSGVARPPRGFGFARFARLEDAAAAIVEAQAGRLLIGGDRPLRVQWVDKLETGVGRQLDGALGVR